MDSIGDRLLLSFTVALFALTFVYGTMSKWYTNTLGKFFFAEHILFLALMSQVLVSVITNSNYPGRDGIRNFLYGGGTVAVVGIMLLALMVQRHARLKRRRTVAERKAQEALGQAMADDVEAELAAGDNG